MKRGIERANSRLVGYCVTCIARSPPYLLVERPDSCSRVAASIPAGVMHLGLVISHISKKSHMTKRLLNDRRAEIIHLCSFYNFGDDREMTTTFTAVPPLLQTLISVIHASLISK